MRSLEREFIGFSFEGRPISVYPAEGKLRAPEVTIHNSKSPRMQKWMLALVCVHLEK